jgi:dipeptidyl aminopeptidase/acylaminoacyl peptidase
MGDTDLWVGNGDGSQPLKLTSLKLGFATAPAWSPDGRLLAFTRYETGNCAVSIIDAQGGQVRDLVGPGGNDGPPCFSPDGQWVYYGSRIGLDWQIHRVAVRGGPPEIVTREPGYRARFSGDGKQMYYSRYGQKGIWRKTLPQGEETLFFEKLSSGDWGNWDLIDDFLYFVQRANGAAHVSRLPLQGGDIEDLIHLEGHTVYGRPAVCFHPQGEAVLYTRIDTLESDINLVTDMFP